MVLARATLACASSRACQTILWSAKCCMLFKTRACAVAIYMLSAVVVCVLVLGAAATVVLLCWLCELCRLYLYFSAPAGQGPLQAYSATDDDVCTLACIDCNLAVLHRCCPTLDTHTRALYNKNAVVVDSTTTEHSSLLNAGAAGFIMGSVAGGF